MLGKRNTNLPSLGGVPPPPAPPSGDLGTMARMQELDRALKTYVKGSGTHIISYNITYITSYTYKSHIYI